MHAHPLVQDNLAIPDLGVVAYLGVPLVAGDGSVVGSLCAIDQQPRDWSARDIAVVTDLAGACSSELQLREARRIADTAAAAAEAAHRRLSVVAQASSDLADADGLEDLHRAIADIPKLLVPALADGCIISLREDSGRLTDCSWWHRDPQLYRVLTRYVHLRHAAMPTDSPLGRVLRTGRSETTTSETVLSLLGAGPARDLLGQLGAASWVHTPIRGRNSVLGVLSFFSATDRPRDVEDEITARGIAGRVGLAMMNQRLAHAQEQMAEKLQRSLLTEPPQPDHGEIAVRYLPAAHAAKVGGDWYDAFLQPGGTTMIAIGDVAGHDAAAATTMGQLRGLLRGIAAHTDAPPAAVLRGVDAATELLMIEGLATIAVARFEQTPAEVEAGTTRMVFSNAGHPPPLVIHPDGRAEFLASHDGRGELMVGVQTDVTRTDHTALLQRGATVVLYTDGLVERRGLDLDAGQAKLLAAAHRLHAATLDNLLDGVVTAMVDLDHDDDVALVAVRLHAQDRPRPAEAGPNVVPDLAPTPSHPAQ